MLPKFKVRNSWKKLELLQKHAWQEPGLWVRRVWRELKSRRRCNLCRRRKTILPNLLLLSCSLNSSVFFHHWTYLESNRQVHTLVRWIPGNDVMIPGNNEVYEWCTLQTSFQCSSALPLTSLCLYTLQAHFRGARKEVTFCLLPLTWTSLNSVLGLSLESNSLENLFWSLKIELGTLNM